jgi:hypothetical protein
MVPRIGYPIVAQAGVNVRASRLFAVDAQAGTRLIVGRAVDALPRTEHAGTSRSAVGATRLIDEPGPRLGYG